MQAQAAAEEQKEKEKQDQIKAQMPKVQRRQQEQAAKMAERSELLEKRANEMIERQKRLDSAVEQYAIRPQVEADEARLIQETKSREMRKGVKLDKADQVSLFKNHGYNIDNLMKDIRFKINTVLAEAGLSGTSYGK